MKTKRKNSKQIWFTKFHLEEKKNNLPIHVNSLTGRYGFKTDYKNQ